MKKYLSLFLLIFCFSLIVACGGNKNEEIDSITGADVNVDISSGIIEDTESENNDVTINKTYDSIANIVPEGANYYHNITYTDNKLNIANGILSLIDSTSGEKVTKYSSIYTTGEEMPTPKTGDILIFNNVWYIYNTKMVNSNFDLEFDETMNGWSTLYMARDAENTLEEIIIQNEINGKPVVIADYFINLSYRSVRNLNSIYIPPNVNSINHFLDIPELMCDLTITIDGKPMYYEDCLRVMPLIEILTSEDGEISNRTYYPYSIIINGDCDVNIKENISKSIVDIHLTIENELPIIVQ